MNPDLENAGALVSAGLATSEIDGASSRLEGTRALKNCANCGTHMSRACCHACGQADHLHRSPDQVYSRDATSMGSACADRL
jgi:hypothetical protein